MFLATLCYVSLRFVNRSAAKIKNYFRLRQQDLLPQRVKAKRPTIRRYQVTYFEQEIMTHKPAAACGHQDYTYKLVQAEFI